MKTKNKQLAFLGLLVSILLFSTISKINADNIVLNLKYPTFQGINLADNQDINQIVAWFYYLIIGISAFAAFFRAVWGGFLWSSSAGNTNQIREAKNMLSGAAIGVLVILSAYIIIQTINPELTTLNLP